MRDLLLLTRAPLAASAIANVVVGWALVGGASRANDAVLLLLALATATLYWGGMALNDAFDLERDRALFPKRPLPSGRISPALAFGLGFGLLAAGIGAAAAAGALARPGGAAAGALAGLAVAGCVLAYDGGLKRHRQVGSLAMASCRFTNALMPAVVLVGWEGVSGPRLGYALLLMAYVTALTYLSTWEDEDAPAIAVAGGFGATLAVPAVGLLAMTTPWSSAAIALGLAPLALVIVARLFVAIESGTKQTGQITTRWLLRGLWLIDIGVLAGIGQWALAGALAVGFLIAHKAIGALFKPPAKPKADTAQPTR